MTKKEVKQAIQRGLGRGLLAVRKDPERYRDLVLWACGQNLAFDTQCEGARTWYIWQLVSCYEDKGPFRDVVAEKLRNKQPDWGWDIFCFSELLGWFAQNGDPEAERVLWEKYAELLARLRAFRRPCKRKWATRDCLEEICLALVWNEENYARIASDLGALFLENSGFTAWDFAWLYQSRPKGFNGRLKKKAVGDPALKAWFASFDTLKREEEEQRLARQEASREKGQSVPAGGRFLSIYLKRKAPELAPQYAEVYLAEKDPEARATALEAFSVCPYPLTPAPIIADAGSEHPALRAAALEALAELRHPSVRRFAMEHLDEEPFWCLLIALKNYEPEDETLLTSRIARLKIDYTNTSGWHGVHLQLLRQFDRNSDILTPPKYLLPVLYETTLCSCCRENAVAIMSKRRMISDAMWEELRWDSQEEIRALAEMHFRRQER